MNSTASLPDAHSRRATKPRIVLAATLIGFLLFVPEVFAQIAPSAPSPGPGAAVGVVAPLPRYAVGDSWTVRLEDGSTVTRRVRAVEMGLYVFEWAPDRWKYMDAELTLKKETTPAGHDWNSYLVNQKLLDFPLSADKTWEYRILMSREESQIMTWTSWWRVVSFKIIGRETVETPAGKFAAFKVEESSREIQCESPTACHPVPNTATARHSWYAPETKSIVKAVNIGAGRWPGQEPGYELAAFDLK